MGGAIERDPGLRLAIAGAGGMRPLARKAQLSQSRVSQWRKVPQVALFAVARACGLDPETLRPDLAEWITLERRRRVLAQGRTRFAIAAAAAAGAAELPGEDEMVDLLMTLAAARFVGREARLELGRVLFGAKKLEEASRARAMALAAIVGLAAHPAIAGVYGCSRQNVDNAVFRYLRARDGDDPDDLVEVDEDGEESLREGGKVVERGRLRGAKAADPEVWAQQQRFQAYVDGRRR